MSNKAENGGITFAGLLQVLFIGLKLAHIIDWPWIWVLSPFWIGIVLLVLIFVVAFVIEIVKYNKRHKRRVNR